MQRRVFMGLGLSMLAGAACGGPAPLANGAPSSDALARAVLEALERKDRPALDALALSEQEFRDHVWPALPAARPERNLPFSYVWGDLRQKSRLSLQQTINARGGVRHELVQVRFSGRTPYPGFVVHRQATFRVRPPEGDEVDIQVCGSMLEKDGVWKVFSYVADD
jgi:hypothetical protein